MTEHYHLCSKCDVDLMPSPCACRDSSVYAYRCEDRNVCEEREGAEKGPYVGEYDTAADEESNWKDYERESK